jgi:hypothetical protein
LTLVKLGQLMVDLHAVLAGKAAKKSGGLVAAMLFLHVSACLKAYVGSF